MMLKNPILFPAEVNRMELPVQRNAVRIAAEFPMRDESNFSRYVKSDGGMCP